MLQLLKNTSAASLALLLLVGCAGSSSTADQSAMGGPSTTATSAQSGTAQAQALAGAWRNTDKRGNDVVMLLQDGFFTLAVFNEKGKQFIGTTGGTYTADGKQFTINYEFDSTDSTKVGSSKTGNYTLQGEEWVLALDASPNIWQRISEDQSNSPLAGTWRITGRERDGEMQTMRPGPRKTLKVLSGTRFQWIAFNSETGQFSGTGGGTYTAENGKYTENIEFFSRDNSRVGMSLSFDFEVKDGNWHHSGQSSTGSPVNEIWMRISND
jgi:hypothetical protein